MQRVSPLSASGRVALVQSKDMTAPIVVMNSSASVLDSDDELSRLMVPVLPAKVMTQVTGAPRLFDADEPTPEWLLHDLRLDLLLFIHEFNQRVSPLLARMPIASAATAFRLEIDFLSKLPYV